MYNDLQVIPDNAAVINTQLPFRGLDKFGQSFLSRFQVSHFHIHIEQ